VAAWKICNLRHLELWGIRLLWRLGCGDFGYPLKSLLILPQHVRTWESDTLF
jgi:hypothetical protein